MLTPDALMNLYSDAILLPIAPDTCFMQFLCGLTAKERNTTLYFVGINLLHNIWPGKGPKSTQWDGTILNILWHWEDGREEVAVLQKIPEMEGFMLKHACLYIPGLPEQSFEYSAHHEGRPVLLT